MDPITAVLAAIIFIAAAAVLIGIVFFLVKQAIRFIFAMVANSIIGLIALAVLSLAGIKIPMTLPVIVSIALFGLGGLGTILVLFFAGVKLA